MAQNTLFGEEVETESDLFKRFLVPPFSVLDTRQGYWQERKKKWINLGIKSDIGREDSLTYRKGEDYLGKKFEDMGATSIFDPHIAELIYIWFTKEGYTILDPFCGGSVRGIVADRLRRGYTGIDLRQEQITANKEQGKVICGKDNLWVCNDSRNIGTIINDKVDFIFSCPPYGNLETYSNNPKDISTLDYPDFIMAYADIINKCCDKLKDNRFACFVVSNFRDDKGNYNNFVSDTITLFEQNGLNFYNDFILLNSVGTGSLRVSKQFR
jgi:hypothetical protein